MPKIKADASTRRPTFIREWRDFRGLTLQRLADSLGVTAGALSQLERGQVAYTQTMLEALAQALQCEPADLLTRKPDEAPGLWAMWQRATPQERQQILRLIEAVTNQPRRR